MGLKTVFVFVCLVGMGYAVAAGGAVTPPVAPVAGTVKWVLEIGDDTIGAPAVGEDGTIYVGSSDRNLYAVNPDGTVNWRFFAGATVLTPSIGEDGTLYAACRDNRLYAVHPDGTRKWTFLFEDQPIGPAIGLDGTLHVASEDGNIYALHPTGEELWTYRVGDEIPTGPAVGPDGTVYVVARHRVDLEVDDCLRAFSPGGTPKWQFCPLGDTKFNHTSPVFGEDGTIYVTFNGYLYALKPDGTVQWVFEPEGYHGTFEEPPAIGEDGTLYFGCGESLYAVGPDGTERWAFPTPTGCVPSTPSIGSNGQIFFTCGPQICFAVNPDGTEAWRFTWDVGHILNGSITVPAVGEDGAVYFGSANGRFYAVHSGAEGLASGPWPTFKAGPDHTSRAPVGGLTLAVRMDRTSYGRGESSIVELLRLMNPAPSPVPFELKIWLAGPGPSRIGLANTGWNGGISAAAGSDVDFAPLTLAPIPPGWPDGRYELWFRLMDPVTGGVITESVEAFLLD